MFFSMKFYYFVDKERVRKGPLPIEDLQSYEITPNTLVWCKGMKKWSKAKDVEELAHLFESTNNKNESDITGIKCIECGYEVSDGASACPNCGCPIENVTLCSECNQLIPDGVEACPNCGYPLMKEEEGGEPKEAVEEITSVYNEEDEDNSRKWLYVVIALLLAAIIGLLIFFGFESYQHSHQPKTVQTVSVSEPSDNGQDETQSTALSNETGTTSSSYSNGVETYRIEGSIDGKYPIVMVLQKEDNVLTGNYYYCTTMRKQGAVESTYIQLSGTIDDDGSFSMRGSYYQPDLYEDWSGYIRNGYFYGELYGKNGEYFTLNASVK